MFFSQQELIRVLDDSPFGVAILDMQGCIVYSNQLFSQLDSQVADKVISCYQDTEIDGYQVRYKCQSGHRILYVSSRSPVVYHNNPNDGLLRTMLEKIDSSEDIFDSVVEAIYDITGWRWVFITRFLSEKTVEVISFWDTNSHVEAGNYELPDSPCEVLVKTKRFTLFTEVAKTFEKKQFLTDLGAKSYAGLIYYGKAQKPIGHIMCMHDTNHVDFKFMEDVIKLASLVISSKLLLIHTQSELQNAVDQASTDSLTQLSNRSMFEKRCQQVAHNYHKQDVDSCICIIDINNFKQFNDAFGHPKGDLLLRLFADELSKLGRSSDQSFRLGGDEFALIMPAVTDQAISRLKDQFSEAQQRLSSVLNHKVSASLGVASLSECSADIEQCYELADIRMYKNKASTKEAALSQPLAM